MDRHTDDREALARALRDCAMQLTGDGQAPLRKLQKEARYLLRVDCGRSLRAIAFLIDDWINDFYLNFTGDIVYNWKEVEEIRLKLLRDNVAPAFLRLAAALGGSKADALTALEELIVPYLEAVNVANGVVAESE